MEIPKELELTPEQEKLMLDLWNKNPSSPPGLKEITKEIFGGDFDGRSAQGRAVKKSLLKFNLRAKATSDYIPKI